MVNFYEPQNSVLIIWLLWIDVSNSPWTSLVSSINTGDLHFIFVLSEGSNIKKYLWKLPSLRYLFKLDLLTEGNKLKYNKYRKIEGQKYK